MHARRRVTPRPACPRRASPFPTAHAGGADSEAVRQELTALDRAVAGQALQVTIRRNLFLAADATARLARVQVRAAAAAAAAAAIFAASLARSGGWTEAHCRP